MKNLNYRNTAGGLLVILLLAFGLWAKHDADAKASDYMKQRDSLSSEYKKEVGQLNASTLVHSGDTKLASKQREVCNRAKALQEKLTTQASPRSTVFLGSILSSKYSAAEDKAASAKASTQQAIDGLHKYYAICDYYTTDNEFSLRYDAIGDSAEYKAQLNFNSSSCNTAGCIPKEHYAAFASIYEKKIPIMKERNDKFKNIPCPFESADQKIVCDKVSQVRHAIEQGDTQYVAALRAGDTEKLRQLVSPDSDVSKAVKDMEDYARKLDPTIPATEGATMYFSHQLANIEKQLQTITL
jgi:hypothetical protein